MDVQLFDTTLRDGTQSEGFTLSVEDKLMIARLLDGFGVHFIEGGFPLSNPKDVEFFQRAKSLTLKHAKLTAFGMTRRRAARPTAIRGCARWSTRRRRSSPSSASRGTLHVTECWA